MQSSYTYTSFSIHFLIFLQLDSVLQEHKRHPCVYIFVPNFYYYIVNHHSPFTSNMLPPTDIRMTDLIILMTGSFCLGPFGKRRGSIRTTCIWLQLRRYVIPHAQHPSEPPLIIAMMHWGSLGGGSSSSRTRER